MLETLKKDYPAVVEDTQKHLSLGEVQKVLQGLLKEQVSIRNMVAILETLADFGGITKDVTFLIEKTRQALGRQICLGLLGEDKTLRLLTVAPKIEQLLIDSRVDTAGGVVAALKPEQQRKWINAVANAVQTVQNQGFHPVILCQEAARPLVKASTSRDFPALAVVSVPELTSGVKIEYLGEIKFD